jgi:hypothetical protein
MTNDTPTKDTPEKRDAGSGQAGVHRHSRRRRHGYRGYPNNPDLGGRIHLGTGFAGVGSIGSTGTSRGGSIFTPKTERSVEELAEHEENEKSRPS